MSSEFRKFAMRGNLIDLAIGFTVGAAFTTVARSLVSDILMPPIGLLLGHSDFSDLFMLLRTGGENAGPYATLADAQASGAVTLNYGVFINNAVTFLLVTAAMFLVVRSINRIHDQLEERFGAQKPEPGDPTEKKCPFCLSTVPYKATRCPACTSQLESSAA